MGYCVNRMGPGLGQGQKKKELAVSTHKHGFPDRSVGKESSCNSGDPSSLPGSGRSLGEGTGYPFQYSGLENAADRGTW